MKQKEATVFGDYIREMRKEKGWSQPELAKQSGLSQSLISLIEKGYSPTSLTVKSIKGLAKAIDRDVRDLVDAAANEELLEQDDVLAFRK